jgi:hypothetical protein
MGRRKTVRQLQEQLKYAQARASYTPPQKEAGTATQRQPKSPYKYNSIYQASDFTVQGSVASVRFFGGAAALGLADAADDPVAPRGYRPATIRAMVADGTPQRERSRSSGRVYTRYGRGSRGSNTQYNFTAPISADTPTALKNRFKTVADAVRGSLGGEYGRVSFEPERLPLVESGGS